MNISVHIHLCMRIYTDMCAYICIRIYIYIHIDREIYVCDSHGLHVVSIHPLLSVLVHAALKTELPALRLCLQSSLFTVEAAGFCLQKYSAWTVGFGTRVCTKTGVHTSDPLKEATILKGKAVTARLCASFRP